jgi:hypothetical protein
MQVHGLPAGPIKTISRYRHHVARRGWPNMKGSFRVADDPGVDAISGLPSGVNRDLCRLLPRWTLAFANTEEESEVGEIPSLARRLGGSLIEPSVSGISGGRGAVIKSTACRRLPVGYFPARLALSTELQLTRRRFADAHKTAEPAVS